MIHVSAERFEELVADALDSIPEQFGREMDNVWVTVEDVPEIPGLLGLYNGVPLTQRDSGYAGMVMPDRITLYRIPICAHCRTEEQVVDMVRVTVIHEVAHHFGIDDARLHELGWA